MAMSYFCRKDKAKMKVYEAIKDMRRRSQRGNWQPFSFTFMSFSLSRGDSHGPVEVKHAVLYKNRKPEEGEKPNPYADHQLTFLDTDSGEVHKCWQPLIMTYEGKKLEGIE